MMRAETHIQEKDQTTKAQELSKIHPTEILNELLIVCLECSMAPERASSK